MADGGGVTESEAAGSAYSIRSQPEDFVVVEEPLYAPTGEGTHTFLYVEKRGRTTEQVARELARLGDASARDVGYAGRKDRHAVTRQWFSIPEIEPDRALDFELEGARVLEAHRHPHKLKTGQLRGNRFEITLRGTGPRADELEERMQTLVRRGLPNRYGEQRFGMQGDNAKRASELLAQRDRPRSRPSRDRRADRFLISALQSAVFNAVLDARGDDFDRVELGDLARVEDSGGLFWVDDLERDRARAQAFEISATGPIFGTKMRSPIGAVGDLEREIFDRFDLPDDLGRLALPRGIRARGSRRALRVRPTDLSVVALPEAEGVRLVCGLPAGAYVTVLLDALVGPVVDASRSKTTGSAPADQAEVPSDAG